MNTYINRGDWIVKNSKEVYDNPWITVRHSDVITPGDTDGIYGEVNFKNLAIGIIPIDQNGYTWRVGQFRFPLNTYSWEIPEGGGPIGIDPLSIIVDMRRYMVMEKSAAPSELNNMMTNIENNGAPWPFNQMDKLNWKNEL